MPFWYLSVAVRSSRPIMCSYGSPIKEVIFVYRCSSICNRWTSNIDCPHDKDSTDCKTLLLLVTPGDTGCKRARYRLRHANFKFYLVWERLRIARTARFRFYCTHLKSGLVWGHDNSRGAIERHREGAHGGGVWTYTFHCVPSAGKVRWGYLLVSVLYWHGA